MRRKELIEAIKEEYAKIKEECPELRLAKLRFKDANTTHISKVRSAHKWAMGLRQSTEYLAFMYWWKQTACWDDYKLPTMSDLPEHANMLNAKKEFQNMVIDTTPLILWSLKRIKKCNTNQ